MNAVRAFPDASNLRGKPATSTELQPNGAAADGGEETKVVLRLMSAIVAPLAAALGPRTEVVLHDLSKLPRSVVAVAGSVTGRRDGSPASDLLLRRLREENYEDLIGYSTTSAEGRPMRSSSLFLKDELGVPFGCLCINTDVSDLAFARDILESMVASQSLSELLHEPADESFVDNVEQLGDTIIRGAIDAVGVPIELMQKPHRLAVVRELDGSGFFLMRDAVDQAAKTLGVSRYTIYNYLKETRVA